MPQVKRRNLKFWPVDGSQKSAAPVFSPPDGEPLGEFLRFWRIRRGWSLDQVCASLRIRHTYLEAIEAGRIRDLPGRIYALGFIRSYAELLGLDASSCVRRLKADLGAGDERAELVFPEPIAERRVPGGAIMAVSICLAIGVYASWYVQTAQNPLPRDLFPSAPGIAADDGGRDVDGGPPARMAMQPPMRPPPTTAIAERPVEEVLVRRAVPRSLPDSAPPQTPAAGRVVDLAAAPRPAPVWQPAEPAPAPEPVTVVEVARSSSATSAIAAPAPPPLPNAAMLDGQRFGPAGGPASRGSGFPPPPTTRGAGPAQAAEIPADGRFWNPGTQLAAVPAAGQPAAPNGPGRIELRAAEPTWIEVRVESTGEIVHGKLLKTGDSYAVPDRPNLKLTTGNAGGLDILVDGAVAPKLGPRGAVMRGIQLEGERLLTGTAVRN